MSAQGLRRPKNGHQAFRRSLPYLRRHRDLGTRFERARVHPVSDHSSSHPRPGASIVPARDQPAAHHRPHIPRTCQRCRCIRHALGAANETDTDSPTEFPIKTTPDSPNPLPARAAAKNELSTVSRGTPRQSIAFLDASTRGSPDAGRSTQRREEEAAPQPARRAYTKRSMMQPQYKKLHLHRAPIRDNT